MHGRSTGAPPLAERQAPTRFLAACTCHLSGRYRRYFASRIVVNGLRCPFTCKLSTDIPEFPADPPASHCHVASFLVRLERATTGRFDMHTVGYCGDSVRFGFTGDKRLDHDVRRCRETETWATDDLYIFGQTYYTDTPVAQHYIVLGPSCESMYVHFLHDNVKTLVYRAMRELWCPNSVIAPTEILL
ncbi:uncharacterized protein YALI1_E22245g [Yarrowia lipolytica]|uniref:Uncharacterized protein n=1 Tax=Yarrowia lipolytica TaxID=4952 RepID=A0A1D8NJ12_YARLL|nr:hypothetical protein YALI1_E22245g [Yarrowia lipolytica]